MSLCTPITHIQFDLNLLSTLCCFHIGDYTVCGLMGHDTISLLGGYQHFKGLCCPYQQREREFHPQDGRNMFFWIFDVHLQEHMMSHPRRPKSANYLCIKIRLAFTWICNCIYILTLGSTVLWEFWPLLWHTLLFLHYLAFGSICVILGSWYAISQIGACQSRSLLNC